MVTFNGRMIFKHQLAEIQIVQLVDMKNPIYKM